MSVSCQEMKRIEAQAIAAGAPVEALMEQAGEQMARAVTQFQPVPGECTVFYGKGHNGGDALVAARHLQREGWGIRLHLAYPEPELAPLTRKKLGELTAQLREPSNACSQGPRIALDGLLGIGATHGRAPGGGTALHEPVLSAAREINRLAREENATVFALDVPTGLDADTGEADPETVSAHFTLCVGFVKHGLLADTALAHVGRLAVMPIPVFAPYANADSLSAHETAATPAALSHLVPARPFDTHKGHCGRVGIIAGSRGFAGAAIMAANAAVRAGAGLVTLCVTPDIYAPVAAAAMPEVMVTPLDCYLAVLERPFDTLDTLAIGPGLGHENEGDAQDILAVCEYFKGPMVIDADALNLLAAGHTETLQRALGPRLLTPHPGEMARLFPESERLTRLKTARRFLELHAKAHAPLTLLLKGSRTLVAELGEEGENSLRTSYNTTGHPGMASGGMGDVLTGTCAALLGQHLAPFDAARLGAWVCGRAAELALSHGGQSQESLAATDLLSYMGRAFNSLRLGNTF